MPALLTRMSTPPNAATVVATPSFDVRFAGHVHRDADRLAAAALISAATASACILVEVGDRDSRRLPRVAQRDGLAEAAGRAGDDRRPCP